MSRDRDNIAALHAYQRNSNGTGSGKPSVPPIDAAKLVIRASDIESRVIKWAWKGRLVLGYLTVQTGEEGLGKSVFDAWLAARVTRGELEGVWQGTPVKVLIVGGEDGLHDTWRPRLELAGADLDRVGFLNLDELPVDWNVRDGIDALRQALSQSPARLIVFDALLDHMPSSHGGENINSPMFVRGALKPLRELVRDLDIAGIYSMHPPKSRGAGFRDLVQASQAFSAIPRTGLLFGWHPDDAEGDPNRRRVIVRGKGNVGRNPGALEFRVTGKELLHGSGETQEREMVVDVEPSDVTLAAMLTRPRTMQGEGEPSKTDQAAEIIRRELADGDWHPASPIREILYAQALNHSQIVQTATESVGVAKRQRSGVWHGGWEWRLLDRPERGSVGQSQQHSPLILTPETARIPSKDGQNHQNQGGGTDDSDPAPISEASDSPEPVREAPDGSQMAVGGQ